MINYNKLKIKKNKIESLLSNGEFNEASKEINEYAKLYPYDLDIYSLKSYLLCAQENYNEAKELLFSVYNKNEYNIELNYNIAMVLYYKQEYLNSMKYLLKSVILDKEKSLDCNWLYIELMKYISEKDLAVIKHDIRLYFSNTTRKFPTTLDSSSNNQRIKKFSLIDKNYYCSIYDYYLTERDGIDIDSNVKLMPLNKLEIMRYYRTNNYDFKANCPTIIPLLVLTDNQNINLKIDNKSFNINHMLSERFYYYRIETNQRISIKSEEDFIIADNIELKRNKNLPPLILNIFVDGLSQKYLEENDFKNLAPNIYNFFSKGTICKNAHTVGEWTYTSLASAFTGMYTSNHRIYHPDYDTLNLLDYELYSEHFKNSGYFCTKIDADYRSAPTLGYMKSFDRYLYQLPSRGMFLDDVLTETIEHLQAYKDTNNFMWVCFPDLHDVADMAETRMSTQTNISASNNVIDRSIISSTVRQKYNPNLVERYKSQIKRIDTYIGLLFDYVKNNYSENDYIISLISDHGQGFLNPSDEFLDETRTNISMMFRGKNIPCGECKELISILDFFPIIINSVNLDIENYHDSNLPKYFGGKTSRDYTYTESLHPNFPYFAVINDYKYKFFFQTVSNNTNDARIHISSPNDFTIKLVNKLNNEDETKLKLDLVEKYTNIVLEHIQEYIIV